MIQENDRLSKHTLHRSVRILSILLVVVATSIVSLAPASAQFDPVSVCDLKLDADNNCVSDTPPINDTVSVEGVVIAWKQFGARGAGAIYDPIGKCCISIFDITTAPDYPIGQMVRVEGWVGNFAGLLEIVDDPVAGTDPIVTDLGYWGNPPLMELNAADLGDFSPLAEFFESCLVEVCGTFETTDTVFAGNANYDFKGQDGQLAIVRIDGDTNLVGAPIPTGLVAVAGVLGQFNNFTDTCIGYQLLPRQLTDISTAKCKVVGVEQQSFGQVKSRFED